MKISQALAIALLTENVNTINVRQVPQEHEYIQSSVVKAEMAS